MAIFCIICEIQRVIGGKSRNFYTTPDPVGILQTCLILIKLKWLGYRTVKKNYNNILSRFHRIPERNGQTDRQTDRQNCYINIARQYADRDRGPHIMHVDYQDRTSSCLEHSFSLSSLSLYIILAHLMYFILILRSEMSLLLIILIIIHSFFQTTFTRNLAKSDSSRSASYSSRSDRIRDTTVEITAHIMTSDVVTDFVHYICSILSRVSILTRDDIAFCLSVCMSVCPSVRLHVCLSVCPSACLSVRLHVRLSVCPSVRLHVCLSVCMSVCPSADASRYSTETTWDNCHFFSTGLFSNSL